MANATRPNGAISNLNLNHTIGAVFYFRFAHHNHGVTRAVFLEHHRRSFWGAFVEQADGSIGWVSAPPPHNKHTFVPRPVRSQRRAYTESNCGALVALSCLLKTDCSLWPIRTLVSSKHNGTNTNNVTPKPSLVALLRLVRLIYRRLLIGLAQPILSTDERIGVDYCWYSRCHHP